MDNNELIPITVWLSGRSYRIRIKAEEEEAVRKAVKIADEKITELRSHYAGKDDQDFIAMCLLSYAADNALEGSRFNPVLETDVKEMLSRIENAIKE
jgi:cell division protein ZapA (FtsZ GTPase activity inhibitor)